MRGLWSNVMHELRPNDSLADFDAHEQFVRRLAVRLCADDDSASEIVQEARIAAWEQAPRERAALRGWLARVVRTRSFRLQARERRHHEHELLSWDPSTATTPTW